MTENPPEAPQETTPEPDPAPDTAEATPEPKPTEQAPAAPAADDADLLVEDPQEPNPYRLDGDDDRIVQEHGR